MAGFALGWWWRAGKEPVGRVEGPEVMPESEQTVLLGGTLAASSGAPEEAAHCGPVRALAGPRCLSSARGSGQPR